MSLVPVVSPLVITFFLDGQCIRSDLETLENQRLSGTSRNVFTNTFRPSRNILLKYFLVQKHCFTSELVFHYCQRSFPVFDMPAFNRLTNVRIGPIVRRVRNLPIRDAHTYSCDSVGYQNELLCTYSQTASVYRRFRRCLGRVQGRLFFRCRLYVVCN